MAAHHDAASRTTTPGEDGLHPTHCRVCPTGCGVLVEVLDGKATRLVGDPADPLSEGYTCGKGRASVDLHYGDDRLDVPLVRGTDGALTRTTWRSATERLADHLRRAIDTYGPDSIGAYRGGGWVLDPAGMNASNAFLRAIGTTQLYSAFSIDCPSKMLIPHLVSGLAMIPQADLERTRLVLFVGVNPLVSHGHATALANPLVRLRRIQSRGGRIVVVDPRRTETAQMADLHVPIRAGTDPALLAMLVREVLARGGDTAYLGVDLRRSSGRPPRAHRPRPRRRPAQRRVGHRRDHGRHRERDRLAGVVAVGRHGQPRSGRWQPLQPRAHAAPRGLAAERPQRHRTPGPQPSGAAPPHQRRARLRRAGRRDPGRQPAHAVRARRQPGPPVPGHAQAARRSCCP